MASESFTKTGETLKRLVIETFYGAKGASVKQTLWICVDQIMLAAARGRLKLIIKPNINS